MTPRPPSQSAEVMAGAIMTVTLHAVVVWFMFFGFPKVGGPLVPTEELPVIEMELLAWGEAIPDPNALPEIANPEEAPENAPEPQPEEPPPTAEATPDQEVVVLNPTEQRPPEDRETEVRQDQQERTENTQVADRGATDRRRPTNLVPVPGSPGGVIGGTSFDDNMVSRQLAAIVRQMHDAIRRPSTISEDDWRRHWARVHVRIESDGRISAIRFVDESGVTAFDRAVRSGLNRFGEGRERLRMDTITNQDLLEVILARGLNVVIAPR